MNSQYLYIRTTVIRKNEVCREYAVSSDRICQWLCLLKLPEEKLNEIESLGDCWEKQVVTERLFQLK